MRESKRLTRLGESFGEIILPSAFDNMKSWKSWFIAAASINAEIEFISQALFRRGQTVELAYIIFPLQGLCKWADLEKEITGRIISEVDG